MRFWICDFGLMKTETILARGAVAGFPAVTSTAHPGPAARVNHYPPHMRGLGSNGKEQQERDGYKHPVGNLTDRTRDRLPGAAEVNSDRVFEKPAANSSTDESGGKTGYGPVDGYRQVPSPVGSAGIAAGGDARGPSMSLFVFWVVVSTPHGKFYERFFGVGASAEEGWEDVQREFYGRNSRLGFLVLPDIDRGEWHRHILNLSADNPLLCEEKRKVALGSFTGGNGGNREREAA